jgi:GT2 family glycosyltransferase
MKKADVVITRYNESDKLVQDCFNSLSKQKKVNLNIIYLEQSNEFKSSKKLCNTKSNKNIKFIFKKIKPISLSYARDLGIRLSKNKYVLFTDIDAMPKNNWAEEMINSLEKKTNTAIVGGKSIPKWSKKSRWYHQSKIVLELYSMVDILDYEGEVEKVVGVNFGINKNILRSESNFNQNLGRKDGDFSGGEETDLCNRAHKKGYRIIYNPQSEVVHQVSKERMSFFWILKRMYYGGVSRSKRGGKPKTFTKKRNIYDKIILPILAIPYLMGYMRAKIK